MMDDMDIWDSLRLTLRHWVYTLPVALVGVVISVLLFTTAATVWKVQTTSVLVGPAEVEKIGIDGAPHLTAQNSFFDAGVTLPLTRVVVLALRDPSRVRQIAAEGYSTDYVMKWENRQPIITTDVTADTPEIASATASRLFDVMADELQLRQDAVNAPTIELASVEVLSVSDPREDFKTPRLVLGLGVVLTIVATILTAFGIERWKYHPAISRGDQNDVEAEPADTILNSGVPGPEVGQGEDEELVGISSTSGTSESS